MKCFNMDSLDNSSEIIFLIDLKIRDMDSIDDVIIFIKYLNQINQLDQ